MKSDHILKKKEILDLKEWKKPKFQELKLTKTQGNKPSGTENNSNSNNGHTTS